MSASLGLFPPSSTRVVRLATRVLARTAGWGGFWRSATLRPAIVDYLLRPAPGRPSATNRARDFCAALAPWFRKDQRGDPECLLITRAFALLDEYTVGGLADVLCLNRPPDDRAAYYRALLERSTLHRFGEVLEVLWRVRVLEPSDRLELTVLYWERVAALDRDLDAGLLRRHGRLLMNVLGHGPRLPPPADPTFLEATLRLIEELRDLRRNDLVDRVAGRQAVIETLLAAEPETLAEEHERYLCNAAYTLRRRGDPDLELRVLTRLVERQETSPDRDLMPYPGKRPAPIARRHGYIQELMGRSGPAFLDVLIRWVCTGRLRFSAARLVLEQYGAHLAGASGQEPESRFTSVVAYVVGRTWRGRSTTAGDVRFTITALQYARSNGMAREQCRLLYHVYRLLVDFQIEPPGDPFRLREPEDVRVACFTELLEQAPGADAGGLLYALWHLRILPGERLLAMTDDFLRTAARREQFEDALQTIATPSGLAMILSEPHRPLKRSSAANELLVAFLDQLKALRAPVLERRLLETLHDLGLTRAKEYVQLARASYDLGDYDAAVWAAEEARKKSPRMISALRMLFRVYGVRKQNEEARAHLSSLREDGPFSLVDLSGLAFNAGQTDLGLAYLIDAMWTEAETPDALLKYLERSWALGDLAAVQQALEGPGSAHPESVQPFREKMQRVQTLAEHAGVETPIEEFELNELLLTILGSRARLPTVTGGRRPGERVAFVIESLGPGGAQRQLVAAARGLLTHTSDRNVESVAVFCRNLNVRERDAFYRAELEAAGIEVHEYRSLSDAAVHPDPLIEAVLTEIQPAGRNAYVRSLVEALDRFRPTVVYGWLDETLLQCWAAAACLDGVRTVGRWGSMPPAQFRNEPPRKTFEAERLRRAYRVMRDSPVPPRFLANTSAAALAYTEWLGWPQGSVGVIQNGYDFSGLKASPGAREDLRARLGIPPEAFVFGAVIRMSEEKRPFLWCDIAARISEVAGASVHFVIVGDGPLWAPVQRYVQERGLSNVHLAGRQSAVMDWYAAMDVFLLTSSVEGMSNSVVEASCSGLPIICFDVGGLAEGVVHGATGFLIPEGDVQAYVDAAVTLARDPAQGRLMGEQGRMMVLERFSLDTLIDTTARHLFDPERPSPARRPISA